MRNKRPLRVIVLICAILLTASSTFAQNRIVTGTITDQGNAPLVGATITVKGSPGISTSTELNGTFRLTVPANAKALVISYVGMKSQEVSIDGKTSVAVSLNLAENNSLDEVVVIGYGTAKRANVTSSISSISEKDIKNLPVSGADQALQGKIAGVTINSNGGQPGGGVSVRVRGITSVNGNEPLYVVDGVPIITSTNSFAFSSTTIGGGGSGQTSNSVLATLNPSDIESIDVLKDASAQAIYGSLAANGVVMITTKHGRIGEGKINYDAYYGQQYVPKKLDMMDLREFATYQNGVFTELNQTPSPEFVDPSVLGPGTNWQDAIFQTGQIQNHQLSFSGGQNKTTYYFSLNYFNQQGILVNSKFKRYSLRGNIEHQVKSWLKAGFSINASRSDQRLTLADEQDGTITQALLLSPLVNIRNLDGSYDGAGTHAGVTYYTASNPIAQANNRRNTANQTKLFGTLSGDFKLASFLTFRTELNYDFQLTQNKASQSAYAAGTQVNKSGLVQEHNNSFYWAFNNYLNFNKEFGVHGVTATAGHANWLSHYEYMQSEVTDLNSPDQISINNGGGPIKQPRGALFESAMESWFGRLGYTYDNRYSLNMSFRADASSNFGPNNKWGYFPAASVGWTVTNERFAENFKGKTLDYLKLRFGAGSVGNQNPPGGAPSPAYAALININTNGFGAGNFLKNDGNLDLKWESVVTYNAGIDASLFNRKVDLTVDVYRKVTKDMLLYSSVPNFVGYGTVQTPIVNAGQMTNRGVDIALTTYNINKKDFTWKTNFIFTHYKNNLDKLINATSSLVGKIQFDQVVVTKTVPGQPVGSFFGIVTGGLYSLAQATGGQIPSQFGLQPATSATGNGLWAGDVRYMDISGPDGKPDGVINDLDQTFIGSPHPKFTYGLTNTFKYKDFDLSLFLQGSYGAKIYNYLRRQLEGIENVYANQLSTVWNRYTATNTSATMPRYSSANSANNNGGAVAIDRFVENGSYLRIQNVAIGYNLPTRIAKKALLNNLRAYVSVQNLYTFTKYTGYDPEIGAFNRSILRMNIDNGHYPNPRTFTFGINAEF
jgi:TonB-dependent starch-binding outer membrane protein SusC